MGGDDASLYEARGFLSAETDNMTKSTVMERKSNDKPFCCHTVSGLEMKKKIVVKLFGELQENVVIEVEVKDLREDQSNKRSEVTRHYCIGMENVNNVANDDA